MSPLEQFYFHGSIVTEQLLKVLWITDPPFEPGYDPECDMVVEE